MVIYMHAWGATPNPCLVLPRWLNDIMVANGYYGVSIFFVISGYLITRLALRRYGRLSAISLRHFYVLRASRIVPGLLLVVGLITAMAFTPVLGFEVDQGAHPIPRLLTYIFTLRANVYRVQFGPVNEAWDILWSLSIEEVFYVAFPLLCLALRKTGLIVLVLAGIFLFGPLERGLLCPGWEQALFNYFSCFDQLALGCLVAIVAHWEVELRFLDERWARRFLWAGSAVIAATYLGRNLKLGFLAFGPTFAAIGAALVLFGTALSKKPLRAGPLLAPLAKLGELSYETYLFHMPVIYLFMNGEVLLIEYCRAHHQHLNLYPDLNVLPMLPLNLGAAWLIAKFILDPVRARMRAAWASS